MPTNAEIQSWLAQRGVQATPQNANIAARIIGADAIASRGGRETGALDASEEINRLYDQLNTRSMGRGQGGGGAVQPGGAPGQGRGDPTPAQNPGNATGGAPDAPPDVGGPTAPVPQPSGTVLNPAPGGNPINPRAIIQAPNALGISIDELQGGAGVNPNAPPQSRDENMEGDTATATAIAAMTGIPLAVARMIVGRGGGGAATAPGTAVAPRPGGGAPAPAGGAAPPGGPPTQLTGRNVPPPEVPALPTPDPQVLLPPPARALPPPAAAGGSVRVPAGDVPPAPPPRMTPPNVPQQSSIGPPQSPNRIPQSSPVQQTMIDAQLSRQAGPRVAGRPTPSPATQAARAPGGVRAPAGAVGRARPGSGGAAPIPWPFGGWRQPM